MSLIAYAALTDDYDVECPHCYAHIATPIGDNPYNGRTEKMQLRSGFPGFCPICRGCFYVTAETARRHNLHWGVAD